MCTCNHPTRLAPLVRNSSTLPASRKPSMLCYFYSYMQCGSESEPPQVGQWGCCTKRGRGPTLSLPHLKCLTLVVVFNISLVVSLSRVSPSLPYRLDPTLSQPIASVRHPLDLTVDDPRSHDIQLSSYFNLALSLDQPFHPPR